jgi:DNA-binding MarR family transcriptional regulator
MTDSPYSALFDAWLAMHLLRRALDDALGPAGLSGDDFALYHLIAANEALTPTEISQWTGMRRSTVTSYLRRMTDRGHAHRIPSPHDGRSYRVALTPHGEAAYAEAAGRFLPVLEHLDRELGGDDRDLRGALAQLDGALRRLTGLPARPYNISR